MDFATTRDVFQRLGTIKKQVATIRNDMKRFTNNGPTNSETYATFLDDFRYFDMILKQVTSILQR